MATQPTESSPLLQTLHAAFATAGRRIRAESVGGRLRGRTLVLARSGWLALAALTVALYVTGVWVWIGQVRGPCPPDVCIHGQVPQAVQRAFAALHLSVSFYSWYGLGRNVLFAAGFAAVAALLFWRRSHDPLALFVSLALVLFALASFESGLLLAALVVVGPGWGLPVAILSYLGELAFGIFVAVFPDGRFVPRWSRLALVLLMLWWLPNVFFPGSPLDFVNWPGVAFFAGWAAILGTMAAIQVYRYRHISTPSQRLQTKWVVYGFVAAGTGYFGGRLVVFLLSPVGQGYWAPLTSPRGVLADLAGYTLVYAGMLLIPICIAIAMLRHHLFDIDVIIRRTLIYSVVTGTLVTVYAVSSIALQAGFQAVTGQGSALAVVASTLGIAALFQPVRSRAQAAVDRHFYRRKYDAAQTVAAFSRTLQSEVDLARVTAHLLAVVEETMQPSQVSLWLARPAREGEPAVWQRTDAAEAEAVRLPKPVPLTDVFAVQDGRTG
jgi:hypothetical protein